MNQTISAVPVDSEEAAHFLACRTLPLALKLDAGHKPYQVVDRATLSLIEIGGRHFFVTCAHVLEKFLEIQAEYPNAQMTAYTTIPHFTELSGFHLVDSDSSILDVAIFRGQEDRVELPGRFFIPYEQSYLADPAINELVVIVGYPGEIVEVRPQRADLSYMQIIFPVSSVSDRHVVLANENGQRKFRDKLHPEPTQIDLGGLSGSAAYVLRNRHYRFIGIVKECHKGDHTILISRLGCLTAQGTIDRSRMPY